MVRDDRRDDHREDHRRSGFAARLRAAGRERHDHARGRGFVDALVRGRLRLEGYVTLLAQHFHIYAALEEAAERMRADPVAGRFVFDELARVPALRADLRFLLGDRWPERIPASRATADYCAHLREVCFDWPGGFVAHHYIRYLGDLSGGQVVRAAVRRAYDLPDDLGAGFYAFPGVPNPQRFKDAYRELLDTAPWDEAERRRITEETLVAYDHNTRVLDELGADLERYLAA
ncbi:biliverdin-producing heme oxygenase [Streptoalloteichus hindustanus]|uniref:Heme oxygenase n=1 Tax=Streptoalloteichus hindustanus TaxID=2017 RepID=A0A1M4YU23_STRHI|nr:biliverdin-producing heme oxygenase [Streptoalloteichus hindustanus]SHF09339.1 heme oxygenase [Streptoalloteichus hindustanus]